MQDVKDMDKICVDTGPVTGEYVITEEDRARLLKEKQERVRRKVNEHTLYVDSLTGTGITRRKDGTYSAVLCIEPTQEMLRQDIEERYLQYYRNRVSLLNWIEENPDHKSLREVLLTTSGFAQRLGSACVGREECAYMPTEVYGRFSKLRIRVKNNRRELHAEFKPGSRKYDITAPYPQKHTINPAMVISHMPSNKYSVIGELICYFVEQTSTQDELLEHYSS